MRPRSLPAISCEVAAVLLGETQKPIVLFVAGDAAAVLFRVIQRSSLSCVYCGRSDAFHAAFQSPTHRMKQMGKELRCDTWGLAMGQAV